MFNAFRHASRSAAALRAVQRTAPVNATRITPFVRTLISERSVFGLSDTIQFI